MINNFVDTFQQNIKRIIWGNQQTHNDDNGDYILNDSHIQVLPKIHFCRDNRYGKYDLINLNHYYVHSELTSSEKTYIKNIISSLQNHVTTTTDLDTLQNEIRNDPILTDYFVHKILRYLKPDEIYSCYNGYGWNECYCNDAYSNDPNDNEHGKYITRYTYDDNGFKFQDIMWIIWSILKELDYDTQKQIKQRFNNEVGEQNYNGGRAFNIWWSMINIISEYTDVVYINISVPNNRLIPEIIVSVKNNLEELGIFTDEMFRTQVERALLQRNYDADVISSWMDYIDYVSF